jgi:Secretion system C-terminal sorting domain/Bacterial Ig domain
MIPYADWRVTDPNALNPAAQANLPNAVLDLNIGDLQGAISAEAVIDLWGGHAGTTGKAIRFNNHDWIPISDLQTTPTSGECYNSQVNNVIDIPLTDLVEGNNTFEGTNAGQTCHSFNWGQHGMDAIIVRIYYNSSKPHPTGSITSPSDGAMMDENPEITATASGSAGINRVDFIAYSDGYDTDGDGVYKDWQYNYHRGRSETVLDIKNHVGTATSAPFQVQWNTDLVPDQPAGSIKLVAHIQDNNGIWFVTDEVQNLTLQRFGTSVKLYKAFNMPESFSVRGATPPAYCNFEIPETDTLANAVSATVFISSWNGIDGNAAPGETHWTRFNNTWDTPFYGADHYYSLDIIPVPPSALVSGVNTIEVGSESSTTGVEVHWPGPGLVVRYGGVPVPIQLSSFKARVISATSVRLEWTTLSETNNYGFEVEKSPTASGPFTTIQNSFVQGHGTTVVPHDYSFTDESATPGGWYYRLKQIDLDGTITFSEPVYVDVLTSAADQLIPKEVLLAQNYPNPFNPSTNIKFDLPKSSEVRLNVLDMLGREVSVLVSGEIEAGYHEVRFDASGLSSGVYFYRLQVGDFVQTRKLLLLR